MGPLERRREIQRDTENPTGRDLGWGNPEMEREKVPNKQDSVRRSLQARCLNRKMRDQEEKRRKRPTKRQGDTGLGEKGRPQETCRDRRDR